MVNCFVERIIIKGPHQILVSTPGPRIRRGGPAYTFYRLTLKRYRVHSARIVFHNDFSTVIMSTKAVKKKKKIKRRHGTTKTTRIVFFFFYGPKNTTRITKTVDVVLFSSARQMIWYASE